ncbi:hypothetical protein EBU71_17530 [bacterium]|nr:hypothetical protein [Candidatus Elulimicrobium humile]
MPNYWLPGSPNASRSANYFIRNLTVNASSVNWSTIQSGINTLRTNIQSGKRINVADINLLITGLNLACGHYHTFTDLQATGQAGYTGVFGLGNDGTAEGRQAGFDKTTYAVTRNTYAATGVIYNPTGDASAVTNIMSISASKANELGIRAIKVIRHQHNWTDSIREEPPPPPPDPSPPEPPPSSPIDSGY